MKKHYQTTGNCTRNVVVILISLEKFFCDRQVQNKKFTFVHFYHNIFGYLLPLKNRNFVKNDRNYMKIVPIDWKSHGESVEKNPTVEFFFVAAMTPRPKINTFSLKNIIPFDFFKNVRNHMKIAPIDSKLHGASAHIYIFFFFENCGHQVKKTELE